MISHFRFWFLTGLTLSAASVPLHAQFKFSNAGGDGRWSNPGNWIGAGASFPTGSGVTVDGGLFTTVLEVDATVGTLRNTAGKGRIWTITNAGGFTLTLDNPNGVNSWGNRAAEIGANSSGGIVCAANLRLRGTSLDVGTTGSNSASAQITLSGAITADTNATVTVRNNRQRTTLTGDIGMSGDGLITLVNLSNSLFGQEDTNQLVITGKLGKKVASLIQGEGLGTGLIIAAANSDFRGQVSVLTNSITVTTGATLGDFNTVAIARGAKLILNGAKALGSSAGLEVDCVGGVVLNFSGTCLIDALSLDGGLSFASPGSTWGAPGSGAEHETAQLQGTGLLRVVPQSVQLAEAKTSVR